MKKALLLLILSTFSNIIFAQDKTIEIGKEIDRLPIFGGCSEELSNAGLRKCTSMKIQKHISKNFNSDIANDIGLPAGKVRILVSFEIDTQGKIINIKAKGPHPKLEGESIRVIELLPDFIEPGYIGDKPIGIPYAIPIVFNVS